MILLYILLPLFGALPLAIIIIKMRKAQRIKKEGVATDAEIIEIRTWNASQHNSMATLILQYAVEAKKEIFQSRATAVPGQFKVGDKMKVFYLPDDPFKITVKGPKVYIPLLVFSIILFLFIIFATFKIGEMA